jgi:hypothetical protein
MLTTIVGVHAIDPYARKEPALMYFFVAIAFMLQGARDWSIDKQPRK